MSTKKYRRKRNEFEVTGTYFKDLETGPVVMLMPDDFDVIEVPWTEFKADFEEVPAVGEGGDDEKDESPGDREFYNCVVANLIAHLASAQGDLSVVVKSGGVRDFRVSVLCFRAILDAARKSLAQPDERCRVGEWLPGEYMQAALKEFVFITGDAGEIPNLHARVISGNVGFLYPSMVIARADWDAARDRWIADGRPAS